LLGILSFCLVFGHVIGKMGDRGRDLIEFIEVLSKSFIEMIRIVIWFSPLGIFSLLCGTIIQLDNSEDVFRSISFYLASCLVGLTIQSVIVLPIMYFSITRRNLFEIFKNSGEALLVAFGTSSSLATLPVTLKCVEQKNRIPKIISRPILFIGTSVHYSGSPVYQVIGALFIAQINNKSLTIGQYFLTSFLTIISSTTVAGIPSGGLITSVLILNGLNIDQSQIGLIFTIDWLIDRFVTVVNVWGNCLATASIFHLSKKEIEELND